MFFRCSRMLSVSPPSPMEVKKLMLKRMLRGVSCKHVCMCPSQCVQCSRSRHCMQSLTCSAVEDGKEGAAYRFQASDEKCTQLLSYLLLGQYKFISLNRVTRLAQLG